MKKEEPAKWALVLRHSTARIRGLRYNLQLAPGAHAPGFMLSSASRTQTLRYGLGNNFRRRTYIARLVHRDEVVVISSSGFNSLILKCGAGQQVGVKSCPLILRQILVG